ncbi:MAG: multiubiquitin domain-containing protein [Planctomycetes bacterium]|nr:multiubiquitin domain-containing protein [Planctomycetota bacterium]
MNAKDNQPQVQATEEELIDVEEYAKAGREKPPGRAYRIRIDRSLHVVRQQIITGREILALVGKTPEEYILTQKFPNGQVKTIEANEKVDLAHPGVERFMTMRRDAQEG